MKLVILDRDGVINEDSEHYIKSTTEWVPIPGSLEAIAMLNNAGYTVAVASNQSGLARGLFDIDALNRIHSRMMEQLEAVGGRIDSIVFCPHGPQDRCQCRKPAPGLLLELGHRYGVPLAGVPVIGDALRDLQAAARVGAADPGTFRQRLRHGKRASTAPCRGTRRRRPAGGGCADPRATSTR